MKSIFAALIFSLISTGLAWAETPRTIKVRLFSFSNSVELYSVGVQTPRPATNIVGVALPQGEKLLVSLNYKETKPIWTLKKSSTSVSQVYAGRSLKLSSQQFKKGTQSLPRELHFWAQGPRVDVVAEIPLEDYLIGVVASEMPTSWPLETLKAQAVAARSYAMSVMRERSQQAFHVDSTILDQVYRHMSQGEANSAKMANVIQAVRGTAGQYLVVGSQIQRPLKAFFHSDCGGKTTTPKNVWSGGVNAGQAIDQSCPANPQANWEFRVSRADLEKKLGVEGIRAIQLVPIKGDTRIQEVRIVGQTNKILSGNRFRELIGYQVLKSALFELSQDESGFVFSGRGFGHGVGLCQWGSRHLGRQGLNYRQILGHYYPLARLQATKL